MLTWRLTSLGRVGTVGILCPDSHICISLIYTHFTKGLVFMLGWKAGGCSYEDGGRSSVTSHPVARVLMHSPGVCLSQQRSWLVNQKTGTYLARDSGPLSVGLWACSLCLVPTWLWVGDVVAALIELNGLWFTVTPMSVDCRE